MAQHQGQHRNPYDLTLESLALGSLTLSPTFAPDVLAYATDYPAPSDLSETVTIVAVPTDSRAPISISYGNADADPATFTSVENGGGIALYTIGASMNRLVLVQVGGAEGSTYRIAVTVRPDI